MPFLDSLDIANRALQHCGAEKILSVTEDSKNNKEVSFAYDKVRRAELRRNVWRFAVRKAVLRAIDTTTMLIAPAVWNSTTIYLPGAIVKDVNGQLWISSEPENVNNSPGDTGVWDMYCGPMTADLFDATTSYSAGELVYKAGADPASYAVYMSLQNGNSDDPSVATAWVSTTTYLANDVVSYGGYNWRSLIPFNTGVTPASGPAAFDPTATYSSGQTVTGSDNFIYSSVGNGNVGNDPVTDGGVHWTNTHLPNAWSRSQTLASASVKWRAIAAAIKNLVFLYPIGAGPSSDATSRNVFRLPAGYLKEAPQDPKAGSNSYLGAPSGLPYDDWQLEGDYLISSDGGPIVFRFVYDVTKVAAMDDMFCEGLACRIAAAICEPVTQSNAKLQTIASEYKLVMGEARTVNAIENGAVEPPEDDYVTCRG